MTVAVDLPASLRGWVRRKTGLPYYCWRRPDVRNFGDELNGFVLERLSRRTPYRIGRAEQFEHLFAIGSILQRANEHSVIWGSGLIARDRELTRPRRITAVRGPHTREALLQRGYACPAVYGDPALLLPLLHPAPARPTHALGLVPHYLDYERVAARYGDRTPVINLLQPVATVIAGILGCACIASSSLHGLIVAEAYGVKSRWVRFSDDMPGDDIKFHDHYASIGIDTPPVLDLRRLALSEGQIRAAVEADWQPWTYDPAPLLAAAPFPLRPALRDKAATALPL